MIVFAVLLIAYGLLHVPGLRRVPVFGRRDDKLAWALGLTLLVTASSHFLSPETLVAMMPPFLPAPELLVWISGVAEIALAVGLMMRRTRGFAAIAAIALFIAVFPANIYAAVSSAPIPNYPESAAYRWLRLPLQFGLMAWAWSIVRLAPRAEPETAALDGRPSIPL